KRWEMSRIEGKSCYGVSICGRTVSPWVVGLEGVTYIDKLDGGVEKIQRGPLTVSGPLDRIYLEPPQALVLEDPVLERAIRIQSEGSRSAVVWNPWIEQAAAMGDFGDLEYLKMLCPTFRTP
ncbi:hypothetical protein G3480_27415, partial [Thiorhodococcus mannitoliphagus]|nr:hypothetical protein [Thiorhodococcus mannitoliphagus]